MSEPSEAIPSTTAIDYSHVLLQSRPNFAKALNDFQTFLSATLVDLQGKSKVLNEQKTNRKTSRNVKTYLSLQIYLLQKHLHRLVEFQAEIHARVTSILSTNDQKLADEKFLQLLADMSKMKTRCKHILDVTDRYCVLENEDQLDAGVESESSSSDSSSHHSGGSPKVQGNVIKTTVTSVSSHLAVIAKTYTKRHSALNYPA